MERIADPGIVAEPFDLFDFEVEGAQRVVTLPAPGRGVFFDHHINLKEPEGGFLTNWLVECFDRQRKMKRHRDREKWSLRLRKIAANAIRAHFYRDPPAVLYSRGAASNWYQDKPRWMRHGALTDVIDPLIEVGLLQGIKGEKMPYGHAKLSWTASYWPTDDFIRKAEEFGVTEESIIPDVPEQDLVQLYAPKPRAEFDRLKGHLVQPRKGKRIWFEPTPQTRQWTEALAAVNAFYRQQKIEPRSDMQVAWLAERNADPDRGGPLYRLPELFGTDLYRVFNDGDAADPKFVRGGRLFGGWWMYASEKARSAITINGAPVVELDYANCHPRMLYHEHGLPGDGDLYAVPEIQALERNSNKEPGTYRPCIKWLTQILINGRGRPEMVERPKDVAFPPDMSVAQIANFIEALHHPIADSFRKSEGLRLMRIESDIALEIITTAMDEGWTVLSVHDSFITTIDKQDRLRMMMIEAYVQRLGIEPVIKG